MIKALEDAIANVRELPEDRQALVAEVLAQIAAAGIDPYVVPELHRAAVLEGLAEAERGEYVRDEEMAALWKSAACEVAITLSLSAKLVVRESEGHRSSGDGSRT
jgi:predicted transcriptional regulator